MRETMRVFDCGSPGYFINVPLNGFLHTAHITCAGQSKITAKFQSDHLSWCISGSVQWSIWSSFNPIFIHLNNKKLEYQEKNRRIKQFPSFLFKRTTFPQYLGGKKAVAIGKATWQIEAKSHDIWCQSRFLFSKCFPL